MPMLFLFVNFRLVEFSGHTTMSAVHENLEIDNTLWICFNSLENDFNLLFDFRKMTTIFDFTDNTISLVLSGYTTMLGVPKNPKVDTKIMNLHKFCRKCIVWPWRNRGPLGFDPQCNVCGCFLINLCLKLYQFNVWPRPNGCYFEKCRHFEFLNGAPPHGHIRTYFGACFTILTIGSLGRSTIRTTSRSSQK